MSVLDTASTSHACFFLIIYTGKKYSILSYSLDFCTYKCMYIHARLSILLFYGIYFVDHACEISLDGYREGGDKHIHAHVFSHKLRYYELNGLASKNSMS